MLPTAACLLLANTVLIIIMQYTSQTQKTHYVYNTYINIVYHTYIVFLSAEACYGKTTDSIIQTSKAIYQSAMVGTVLLIR